MVEIALSPLQDQGLPLIVAAIRDIGAYPRVQQALQRARYSEFVAQLGRAGGRRTRPAGAARAGCRPVRRGLAGRCGAVSSCSSPTGSSSASPRGVGAVPGEAIGTRVANRPDTLPGFVLQQGQPVIVEDYRSERRFVVPPAYLEPG